MTLHEDWHKAHPGYPCEYDTCPRGQVLDLENATYTAAEVKVLTEAALRLGRKEALEEAVAAVTNKLGITSRALPIIRSLFSQPAPDATSARTQSPGYSDLPQDSQAGRSSQGDVDAELARRAKLAGGRP